MVGSIVSIVGVVWCHAVRPKIDAEAAVPRDMVVSDQVAYAGEDDDARAAVEGDRVADPARADQGEGALRDHDAIAGVAKGSRAKTLSADEIVHDGGEVRASLD